MGPGPAGIPQFEYIFSRIICTSVPIGYIALLVILIIAGIKYLTSGGEPKAISQAHQTVTWGFLGIVFLAISWLILQLIQNFTGIQVTKFTLASLPGVEGFTGSCWEASPVAPPSSKPPSTASSPNSGSQSTSGTVPNPNSNSQSTSTLPSQPDFQRFVQPMLSQDPPPGFGNFDCIKPTGFNFPVEICKMSCQNSSDYLVRDDSSASVIAYKPEAIKELGKVLTEPRLINILIDSNDDRLYSAIGYALQVIPGFKYGTLTRSLLLGQTSFGGKNIGGMKFARFEKESIPKNLILGAHDAQQLAKKLENVSNADYDSVEFNGLGCNDGDFYQVTILSPLIYLFSPISQRVNLQINSPILSPVKNWVFIANPKGEITTLSGEKLKNIPYEFLRRDFKRPEKGIVVSADKLVEYLRGNLWKSLGLTDIEIEDYWQDIGWRIPKSPYYFISLIDRSEIDRVLPMEVNPKPDTIIRNMTYILPLSSPFIPIPLPEVKAPDRNGFTVLENGGFIDGF